MRQVLRAASSRGSSTARPHSRVQVGSKGPTTRSSGVVHSSLAATMAGLGQVTCHVVQSGAVDVVLSAGEELDVSVGVARVVVSKFVFGEDVH